MRRNWSRSFLSRVAVGGLVLALVPTVGGSAFAQGKDAKAAAAPAKAPAKKGKVLTPAQKQEEAKKAFEDGKAKFDAGDFAGAYEAFKTADELVPGPVPKFRMAECLDKQGKVDEAQAQYEAFLAAKPDPEKQKARIETANTRIAALKVAPAEVKVVIQPAEAAAAALSLDGAPAQNPVKAPPGKHTISAKLDGFEDGKVDIEVGRNEKKEVTIALTAKPKDVAVNTPPTDKPKDSEKPTDKPKEPAEPASSSSVIPAAVTLSLAGAGLVVGAVFGGLALKSKGEFEDTPTQDLFDETERNALIADMSFGVALTFGVTGVVLLLTDSGGDKPAEPEKKPAATGFVVPWAGPHGAGAMGVVNF